MKVLLLVVGKTTNAHIAALTDDYLRRLDHYLSLSVTVLPAVRATKALSEQQQKDIEGDKILQQLLPNDTVVLLDEHGAEYDSVALAQWLAAKQRTAQRLVFIIGGPYGFAEKVYARADEQLSLSRLTLSHQLVRVFFVEQLYRASTILRGEKYHHP